MQASARDHGLRRVRGATGWISALAAVGGLALAGGYAAALPGKAYTRAAGPATTSGQPAFGQPAATTPAAAAHHPAAAAGHRRTPARPARKAHALRPPAQAPTPAPAPAHTVSGAS